MSGPAALTRERLRSWVEEAFGIPLQDLERVGQGADVAAQLWRGSTASGASYAVKLSSAGSSAGLVVAAGLATRRRAGVPPPLRTTAGQLVSRRGEAWLSVSPWVSALRALSARMTVRHWRGFGELLGDVHRTAPTRDLAALLPHEDHRHERIAGVVRSVEPRLSEPFDELSAATARCWSEAAGVAGELLEHADALGWRQQTRPAAAVVCHGDPHLGNVLIDDEDRVWLVDWDDAVLAPPERDLMFVIGGGALAFAPISSSDQEAFLEGYGPVEVDEERLSYYQCVRAMDDLSGFALQAADPEYPLLERREALDILAGLMSPAGLATLALASARARGVRRPGPRQDG